MVLGNFFTVIDTKNCKNVCFTYFYFISNGVFFRNCHFGARILNKCAKLFMEKLGIRRVDSHKSSENQEISMKARNAVWRKSMSLIHTFISNFHVKKLRNPLRRQELVSFQMCTTL